MSGSRKRSQKIPVSQFLALSAVGVFVVGAAAVFSVVQTQSTYATQASSSLDSCPNDSFVAQVVSKDGTSRKVCKCLNGAVLAFGSTAQCPTNEAQPK